MLDSSCTSRKQSDFFSKNELANFPLSAFSDLFAYYFVGGKKENIPISIKDLGFLQNVKQALKSRKPIMCIADGILTLIIGLCWQSKLYEFCRSIKVIKQ